MLCPFIATYRLQNFLSSCSDWGLTFYLQASFEILDTKIGQLLDSQETARQISQIHFRTRKPLIDAVLIPTKYQS